MAWSALCFIDFLVAGGSGEEEIADGQSFFVQPVANVGLAMDVWADESVFGGPAESGRIVGRFADILPGLGER